MVTIFIENKPYEVTEGENLLHACLSLGFNLPYFCWHPAMHSVGSCRQCAVKQFKDEHDTHGRIIMSCMTPVENGIRISLDDPEAVQFRRSVIEWLMLNHPHDCPVCDEGGECHLQDMTVMTGHVYRRTRFKKRTYRNQKLGPFVNHEMNRCIQCYRCLRFYRDYAGGRDFGVFASHDHVYFGRSEEGRLESEFSGNLVEVCPTGVFTDKTLKQHYTRKWDLQTAPSVCVHCGLGCNTIPGERYGEIRRIRNRYNGEVNGYFLCDRGRYGYEFMNSEARVRIPVVKRPQKRSDEDSERNVGSPTRQDVLKHLEGILYFGAKVIGIGSPRSSLEANFALRTLVGPENFYAGISAVEFPLISLIAEILQRGPARSPSLLDIATSDAVFLLGEDVSNTAPMAALAIRQSIRQRPMNEISDQLGIPRWHDHAVRCAIQNEKGPLFIATPAPTRLDTVATEICRAAPDDLARLGFAVAHELNDGAAAVTDLSAEMRDRARRIAKALHESEKPLIISGTGCANESVIKAAANVAWALCKENRPAGLSFHVPECNTLGLALMGGNSLSSAFRVVQEGKVDTAVVLENDLYVRADKDAVDAFFGKLGHAIIIDCIKTSTTSRADVLLPAGTYTETDGTLVNNEGRAQRFFKVLEPEYEVHEDWRWLIDMIHMAERPEAGQWKLFEDVTKALSETFPVFKPIVEITPHAAFRTAGMKVPRQPHRYSGRTSMHAHISVDEPKPPDDPDSPLSFSMEGYEGMPPSSLIPRFWSPGWNSVQAVNKFQNETGGPLRGGDPGRRLIEPHCGRDIVYFRDVPEAFHLQPGELLVIPLYHIYGSEELSRLCAGIAGLMPRPYLGINPHDMKYLEIPEGAEVEIMIRETVLRSRAKRIETLPKGIIGLPVGLPGLQGVVLPAYAKNLLVKMSGAMQ